MKATIQKGNIVLVSYPFASSKGAKIRPALVLLARTKFPDNVLAFITSVKTHNVEQTEVLIDQKHPEFSQTGLKKDSKIVLDKVATVLKRDVKGSMGDLGPILRSEVNKLIPQIYRL
ncbi:type II toxin-antitoxin system PemK/MazF family toxin [Candidatus Lokiarchaeum ossiferum]|uniref:type II toxin-antitoxin system PemK/MazF family toxin n=1 Tax=Candidatus Lokiarchaeum ossiferum TaxID=2951803 RepID=UPI00352E4A07